MGVDIQLKPELQLLSRKIVLHHVVDELARSLGAPESSLKTIRKGILERAILSDVIFCYMRQDTLVGRISVSVDWEKHQLLAETEEGKTFSFNAAMSIARQISEIFPILAQHAEQLRRAQKVDQVSVWYRYRTDIRSDPEKLSEARTFLGLSPDNMPEWATRKRFDIHLEYSSRKLAELGIKIEHGKK